MYDYVKASATNLGMESPHTIADTAAKAVKAYFEALIPTVMVKVFANTAAKYLQSEGRLNPTNVASLAVSYADALTEIAKENVDQHDPETKLKALMDGIEKFFTSVDLLVADEGQTIASTFGNEVKLAGLELLCNEFDATSLLQVRLVVTSSFVLTCGSHVVNLRSCRVKLAASLQSKTDANFLQTKIAIWGCTYKPTSHIDSFCSDDGE
ncbi:hypothetical protein AVEN_164655-1 [Araneus ventricosus]|uniref:Uncharacterized protein n=1 Tax=Araneus ventricosus TaxID=182803 RepID=A0A4Y2TTS9_ARAVE|nr:hypothetical protein AVEN_164655-1 [Araneus ventricosus]